MLCQLPVFALQYCCLNFCGHGLLAVVARFERLADAMAAEAKATAKAAAKPKAKGKAPAGSVCIFDAWSGCHFWGHEIVQFLVALQTASTVIVSDPTICLLNTSQ